MRMLFGLAAALAVALWFAQAQPSQAFDAHEKACMNACRRAYHSCVNRGGDSEQCSTEERLCRLECRG